MKLALLPDDVLIDFPEDLEHLPFNVRQRRMLRLAIPTLRDCAVHMPEAAVPLFLALPEPSRGGHFVSDTHWLKHVVESSQVSINLDASTVFASGRAACFEALAEALTYLAQGRAKTAIVGGVDTFLDPWRLGQLDSESRLLNEGSMDGFIPGEGAAFVAITIDPRSDDQPATVIRACGLASDPGHRYGDAPDLGQGLADAIERLREGFAPAAPAQFILCGLNGEAAGAKEWGVAQLRHRDILSAEAMFEHPADCYGDLGAATGAMLLALSDAALRSGAREAPSLIWASSDREMRGCAWIEAEGL